MPPLNSKTTKSKSTKAKYSSFKRLENVAEKNSSLGKLLQRANNIMAHQETVHALLEPSCRSHCWLANYRNGILYLQTDSAAWGTRLRMQQRAIVKQLKSTSVFAGLQSIKVLIQPRYSIEPPHRTAKTISKNNIDQLLETAAQTEDKALKAALIHLAQTSRNKSNSD